MTGPTTTRRTIVNGAAWTAPVLTAAAVAPALAASPVNAPNLSTSTSGGVPTRTTSGDAAVLTIAPSTIRNSGDVDAQGLSIVFTSNTKITNLQLNSSLIGILDLPFAGVSATGLGTTTVTMTVADGTSLGYARIAPDATWTSPASQVLTFGGAAATEPITLDVQVVAGNGGVPWASPHVECSTTACTAS